MAEKRRLTRADWTDAALAALADGGIGAVAIEPLAGELGATKGSAYWHFANREALLTATLRRWRDTHTEAVIDRVEARDVGPAEKLRLLFAGVFVDHPGGTIELRLQAAAHDPIVSPILEAVNKRRIAYLATLFRQLGCDRASANRRALIGYSAFLGQAQLMSSTPGALPRGKPARRAYVDEMARVLTAGVG
ncbi:MAG: TetR/AcrR family transcriptional regulator [Sciscionella sp.]|nr:TetR/AcrR family transcriptional regulator [Sciscionella sp.]